MRVGISCFLTDKWVSIVELAREVEARGFGELWLPEHTHIPTSRNTAWPIEDDAELPEMYKRSLDPFVALILGAGFGWNTDEMRHHGVDPDRRRAVGREKVLAMKELWTQDEASFPGEFVDFSPSWQWPKPIQQPHPPIWVGGGRSTMKHAVEWGDGWMPIEGVMPVAKMTRDIRTMAAAAGRDPAELTSGWCAARPGQGRRVPRSGTGRHGPRCDLGCRPGHGQT